LKPCYFCGVVDPNHRGSTCPEKPSNKRLNKIEEMMSRIEARFIAAQASDTESDSESSVVNVK